MTDTNQPNAPQPTPGKKLRTRISEGIGSAIKNSRTKLSTFCENRKEKKEEKRQYREEHGPGKFEKGTTAFWAELKETYGKPLYEFLMIIAGGTANEREGAQGQKVEGFDRFMGSFWNETFAGGVDKTRQSEQLQKALTNFSLALVLMSHFSLKSNVHMKKYFQAHGIEDSEALTHYAEMKNPNSSLYKAVMETLRLNGKKHMKKCHQMLNKKRGKMHFSALAMEMFKWFEGAKSPTDRKKLKAIFKQMLSAFHHMCEQNPHLKEFLQAVEVPMLQAIQKKQENETKEQKLYEKHIQGIEKLFRLRTPEFKSTLERLFTLKTLDSKRMFALSQTETGKVFLAQFGINANQMTEGAINEYLGVNLKEIFERLKKGIEVNTLASKSREDIIALQTVLPKIQETVKTTGEEDEIEELELLVDALEEISEATITDKSLDEVDEAVELVLNLMPEMPSKTVDFSSNKPLGRKKARDNRTNFDSFKKIVEEKIDSILEVLLHEFPKGKKANSLKELIEMMLKDEKVTLAGDYERIIMLGNRIYEQSKEPNRAIWEALEKVFEENNTDALQQAKDAVEEKKEKEKDTTMTEDREKFNKNIRSRCGALFKQEEEKARKKAEKEATREATKK